MMNEPMTEVSGVTSQPDRWSSGIYAYYGKVPEAEAKRRAKVYVLSEIARLQSLLDHEGEWSVEWRNGYRRLSAPPAQVPCTGDGFCPSADHEPTCIGQKFYLSETEVA